MSIHVADLFSMSSSGMSHLSSRCKASSTPSYRKSRSRPYRSQTSPKIVLGHCITKSQLSLQFLHIFTSTFLTTTRRAMFHHSTSLQLCITLLQLHPSAFPCRYVPRIHAYVLAHRSCLYGGPESEFRSGGSRSESCPEDDLLYIDIFDIHHAFVTTTSSAHGAVHPPRFGTFQECRSSVG